jgi:vitamin-K-epoxide reductase (warfarin-sensitive)
MQISMRGHWLKSVILGCCVLGAILSAVSLQSHYSSSATDYCDLNATFNCDLVNRSTFSELHGIPVALVGLLGYILLFALSLQSHNWATIFRFAAALVGVGFALYLAYIEAYVLAVWCLLCIGSLAMILTITMLAGIAVWRLRKREPQTNAGQ